MFRKVNVPVLGFIENMSYHICSQCGYREHIFDHGGAKRAAEDLGSIFWVRFPWRSLSARPPDQEYRPFSPTRKAPMPRPI